MKRCKQIMTAQRYIDGELPDRARKKFEAHLAGCSDCKTFCRETQSIKTLFNDNPAALPSFNRQFAIIRNVEVMTLAGRKEYLWETIGNISRKFIPATAVLCLAMLFLVIMKFPAKTSVSSTYDEGHYLSNALDSREKAFLSEDDKTAAGSLYYILASNNYTENK